MYYTLFKIAFIMIIISFIYYIKANNLKIDFKSFFRKGFRKVDNDFGLYCYTGKQRERKDLHMYKFSYQLHSQQPRRCYFNKH